MSEKNIERLEREAREALVAADLSAKMKQWRQQPPPPDPGAGAGRWRLLALLLALAGTAWWLWPETGSPLPQPAPETIPAPAGPQTPPSAKPAPTTPSQAKPQPMAEKPVPNRYLALATSNYRAPNFAAELRGESPELKDPLNPARNALAKKQPAEALKLLQSVPDAYETDAKYLRAHALFGVKKYSEAAALFGQLTGSMRYGEAAQWYGILAQLPEFEQNKAVIKSRLGEIANDSGHSFQREAQELAEKLVGQQ